MTSLLVAKQKMIVFFEKYDVYIMPVIKFLIALISLSVINNKLGYMEQINELPIVLIAALMCSFMPTGFILVIGALFVMLHFYKLSIECAIVVGVVFLLLALLFFRFSPKDSLVVLLTPLCFVLKIPYTMPILMGLIGAPVSAVSVACGVIVYYLVAHVNADATALGTMTEEAITTKIKYLVDGMIHNKAMIMVAVAFAMVLIIVYVVRRLSIDYAWPIAIIVGVLSNIVILIAMELMSDIGLGIGGVLLGSIVAGIIAYIYTFFFFNLDYTRQEKVQFEDDDYYYYVKAVPKMTVAAPKKKVKKINAQKREHSR